MDPLQAYTTTRDQLVERAATLGSGELGTPVPACPGWSVKDTYGHVVGAAADIINGRMDGAGEPSWTARQVAERKDQPLEAMCEEWTAVTAQLPAWLDGAGPRGLILIYDLWNHQQDIDGALGSSGIRDARVPYLLGEALSVFDQRLREAKSPAVRMRGEQVDRVVGGDAAELELTASDFELLRTVFGRRSQAQIDAMAWSGGDHSPCVPHLHLFELPEVDLSV